MKLHKYRGPRLARFPRHLRRLKKAIHVIGRAYYGGITSPPRPWFRLSCPDLDNNKPDVRAFIATLEAAMARQLADRPPWWLESDLSPHMRKYRYCARIANVDLTIPIHAAESRRQT